MSARVPSSTLLVAVISLTLAACSTSSAPAAQSTTPVSPADTTLVSPSTPADRRSEASPSASTTPPPASTTPPLAGPCGTGTPPATYQHVVWIWMENHSADEVLGQSAEAPFEQELARRCASTTTYRAVGSPSLPNYIAATSGDTQGIHDDAPPAAHPLTVDNLFRQVRAGGGTARSYEETMTQNCALRSAGRYAVKHNPQPYFVGPTDRSACQTDDVPLGSLGAGPLHDDLPAGRLPTFAFVTPDLCDDTHDCDVSAGDQWLADWVSLILASPTYQSGSTAVFIVWDEPTPMPMLVITPSVKPGTVSTAPWDHYSLLRTTEDLLGIDGHLGRAADAPSMRAAFTI
jgi:phosphatidylinositol-3-phosphatase